jgi:hypothetical protein
MADLPPPPPGFVLEGAASPPPPRGMLASRSKPRDPYETLKAEGFTFTNGFRTEADVERIRAQGYAPATDGAHNRGDGVDLTHSTLTPRQQTARLKELFADWDGFNVIDEGHHRHAQFPGWGAAPGTPGTPNSGLPPLPPGFELQQRGALTPDNFVAAGSPNVPGPKVTIKGEPAPLVSTAGYGRAFFDELPEAVASKLSPQDVGAWQALARDMKSTPDQLRQFMKARGFDLHTADEIVKARNEGAGVTEDITYKRLDPIGLNDGATGATMRGVADPFNVLDETGAVFDTLGLTKGRKNIWNSELGIRDLLNSNIDANRAVLEGDAKNHGEARFLGQLGSGLLLPIGGGARTAAQIAKYGAAEGAVAGFGAGEGNPLDRAPNAAVGTALGATGGYALGRVIDDAGRLITSLRSPNGSGAYEAAPVLNDAVQASGPTPAARTQPQGGVVGRNDNGPPVPRPRDQFAAMDSGIEAPTLTGPRVRDRIDVNEQPPLPAGFVLDEPQIGRVRPMGEQASADDIAAAARRVDPEDMTPIPANAVESLDEFEAATGGIQQRLRAPDPYKEMRSRDIPVQGRPGEFWQHKGPIDAEAFLRRSGGLRDEGGDLAAMGITNAARAHNRGEARLGKLVDNENGQNLDDAAFRLWEAGYFPDHHTRPDINDLLDVLAKSRNGNRTFHPDDFDEVDRFNSATADAHRIGEADQEGRPLYADRGQPTSFDDLRAREPAAYSYEDLPTLGGKAGNINLDHIETRADIRRALINSEAKVGGFDAAKRGKITQAETSALADELGMTPADLLKRRKGQALNAEQLIAARRMMARSAEELVRIANKVKGGSDADVAAFRKAWVMHVAIQEQVTAATSEAGRALAQFKMLARSRDHSGRVLEAVIQGGGGRDRIEDVAEAILNLQRDPNKLNSFARLAMKPTWKDKAIELWYNSLLSGPATHAVNVLSNAMTAGLQIPEMAVASAFGAARNLKRTALAQEQEFDRVMGTEIGARTVGLMQGTREGLRAFGKTFRTGEVPDMVTKVESRSQKAISGLKGEVLRTPTRLLAAEDELFKAIARRMEINGLAVRKARGDGLRGAAFKARVEELSSKPTDEMMESALDYARYLTYQRPLGAVGQAISRITMDQPWLKLFVPFIRTPTNIFKFVAERSPAAPFMKSVQADLKAGGARRDLAAARMVMGTGLGAMVTQWASEGIITGGGPADQAAKDLMRADGWQPYSIKIGGKYYSYQRLDPLASTLGIAADLVDIQSHMTEAQRGNAVALVVTSIIKNMANKTWLSGVTDLASALSDPGRYGEGLVAQLAGSIAVPTLVNQITRTTDPILREARDPIDRIKSRIPGLSKTLPARVDIWGQEIRSERGFGDVPGAAGNALAKTEGLLSPIWVSTARNDPVNAEMLAIGAQIGKPSQTAHGRRLSDAEYGALRTRAGQYTKEDIAAAMRDPEWKTLDIEGRLKWVNNIKDDARDAARDELFGAAAMPAPPPGFEMAR